MLSTAATYIDEIDENYRNFREGLRTVLEEDKDSRDFASCELDAPRDGFRFVTIYFKVGAPRNNAPACFTCFNLSAHQGGCAKHERWCRDDV